MTVGHSLYGVGDGRMGTAHSKSSWVAAFWVSDLWRRRVLPKCAERGQTAEADIKDWRIKLY